MIQYGTHNCEVAGEWEEKAGLSQDCFSRLCLEEAYVSHFIGQI